jgi:hypothetical protein
MNVTFAPSTNAATNGVALSTDAQRDVVVHKLIVGTPVSAGNVWLRTITNPISASTANIAFKMTLPTFSTTNVNPGVFVVDFGPAGLPLNQGGNLEIDQTMNVTVIWDYLDEIGQ